MTILWMKLDETKMKPVICIINQILFLVGLGVSTETGVATDVLFPLNH